MNCEIMKFLDKFTKSGKSVNDLSRFSLLMDKLGNPQNYLKFIHIAGTNGKGSAAGMLANSLTKAGYKTGEFTSPFIYCYNDRIKINKKMIPDDELLRIIRILEPVIADNLPGYSQFEITNAIAFIYFAEQKCDVVVLETGLGGLLDSTNIIKKNICSVIMSISLDHTAILGDTIEKIAYQKAGIIKDDCPVVLYPQNPRAAEAVIAKYAVLHDSPLIIPDTRKLKTGKLTPEGCSFIYRSREYATAMPGRHQVYNAITVIEAAGIIRKKFPRLTDNILYKGIAETVVPSRCQVVRKSSPMVIIDGAHNPDGMRALSEFIAELPHFPKVMICGMNADKDWKTALSYIAPYIDKAYCIDGFCPNTVFSPKLAECFSDADCIPISTVYHRACSYAGSHGLVLIGGSLYIPSTLNKFST